MKTFITTTIEKRTEIALKVIRNVRGNIEQGYGDRTVMENHIKGAVNKLRHAADELEAEMLDYFHDIGQGH